MANNLGSNYTRKLMRAFLPAFEKQRVLSKTVNTQMFSGKFNPASGDYVDIKRPHQYISTETSTGVITTANDNTIIAGKATAQVQNYITVPIPWTNKEEALNLDQMTEILAPAAAECVIALETNLCDFMIQNSGLTYGTPGTVIDAWSDIAGQMSLVKSLGVPAGEIYSVMSPFTIQNLASAQSGLYGADRLIKSAWEDAQISTPFAGLKAISSNSLSTYTCGTLADRTGSLGASPDVTYVTAKDSMTQSLTLADLGTTAGTIVAGEVLEYTGTGSSARSMVNIRTRKTIFGADNNPVKFRQTVVTGTTSSTAGAATITVTPPAIFESGGQYNNCSAAITSGDVVAIKGTASTEYQPNLFFHKDAFAVAYVKLPKLYSTDTVVQTSDGISLRISKYSDGDANTQKIRIDLLPAFACLNPFFGGKGFGL